MNIETILWGLGIGGFTALGGAFLVKIFVESGIKEAVKLNFSKRLEEYKQQFTTEVERLRSSLKNSEVFFARQLEALTVLRTILRKIVPKKRTPDEDWSEACEDIAHSFSIHADKLDEFQCNYQAVLPPDVVEKIEDAIRTATDGTFEFYWDSERGVPEATSRAIDAADELYHAVRDAVEMLQKSVDSQVGNPRI